MYPVPFTAVEVMPCFSPVNPSVHTAGFSTTDSQFHEQTVCTCVSDDQVVLSLKISRDHIAETRFHFFTLSGKKQINKIKSRLMGGHAIIFRL